MSTQTILMCLPIDVIFVQREQVKLLPRSKKCYFHSPLYGFWLTNASQIESSKATQYTPLYKKRKFKRKSSQWWLLMPATSSHLDERQPFNKSSFSTEPAKSRIYIFVIWRHHLNIVKSEKTWLIIFRKQSIFLYNQNTIVYYVLSLGLTYV